ncbi:hypothetical protein BLA29_013167 [Euroglyphus maynei]|uniref:Uncharacterized protein n=1 Tax=Euroglyphus maynei TaxID=6958 RepID=A0A1Y3AXE6_EURMA|nr:hypothetical protein BLA29_013167 [Euroglyphus maynei]
MMKNVLMNDLIDNEWNDLIDLMTVENVLKNVLIDSEWNDPIDMRIVENVSMNELMIDLVMIEKKFVNNGDFVMMMIAESMKLIRIDAENDWTTIDEEMMIELIWTDVSRNDQMIKTVDVNIVNNELIMMKHEQQLKNQDLIDDVNVNVKR